MDLGWGGLVPAPLTFDRMSPQFHSFPFLGLLGSNSLDPTLDPPLVHLRVCSAGALVTDH